MTQERTDAFVRRQTYLDRYANGLTARVLKTVDVDRITMVVQSKKLTPKKKVAAILREVKRLNKAANGVLLKEIKALYTIEIEWLHGLLDRMEKNIKLPRKRPATILNEAIDKPLLVNNGATAREGYDKVWTRLEEQTIGVSRSIEYGTIAQTVAHQQLDYVYRQFERNLQTSTKTAAFSVNNSIREELYQANEDVIRGVMFTAVLDGRTTHYCMTQDGVIVPLSIPRRPPFHYNCRTIAVAVFRGETNKDALETLKFRSSVGPGDKYEKGLNTRKGTSYNVKTERVKVSQSAPGTSGAFLSSQANTSMGREFIRDTMGVRKGNRFIKQVEQGKNPTTSLRNILVMDASELDLDGLKKRKKK